MVESANEEDLRYYVEEDPAHVAFKRSLEGMVRTVGVVDFVNGVW